MTGTRAQAPTSRQPRLQILTNGSVIPGSLEAETVLNNNRRAGTFTAKFAYGFDQTGGLAWWDNRTSPMDIDIQVGMGQSDGSVQYTSIMRGQTDQINLDPDNAIVDITGRDYTVLLIEAKTEEQFVNQTTSAIATTLAGRVGLTANVVPTTTPAGRFWQIDRTIETRSQQTSYRSYWDLLTELAKDENLDLWVSGMTLNLQNIATPGSDDYVVSYQPRDSDRATPLSNVMRLKMTRNLTLAKGIIVNVHTFNSKTGSGFVATAKSDAKNTTRGSKPQVFDLPRPNLDLKSAQDLADSTLAEISRAERVISWTEPGNFDLTCQSIVQLQGTNTSFDQSYHPDHLTLRIGLAGFELTCSAKNHSVSNTLEPDAG